jgi:Ricin-type beta-trefoil lectin domain/Glycosyl hydrolases family 43
MTPRALLLRRLIAGTSAMVMAAFATFSTALPALAQTASNLVPGGAQFDQNAKQVQLHGLGIVKVGSTYYGFGEDKTGESSAAAYFQNIPCYHSTDLTNWTYQSEALTKQASGDLGPNRIVERPKVIYNASTAKYVMYLHIDDSSYGEAKVGVATSSSVCGPYTYIDSFQPLGFQSRDEGLFQDTNGSAYLLSEDRANGLRIDALSADYLTVTSSVALFADYEAPAMFKVGSRYYLLGSHLTGWSTNDNQYTSSTSLSSGWSAWSDFATAGSNTYNSQTSNVVTVAGSSATTYVFTGDRWNTSNLGASALLWLPITVSGATLSVGWHNAWSLNASAGTWSSVATSTEVSAATGKCLDDASSSDIPGAPADMWTCNSGSNQAFQSGGGELQTEGMCLDVSGAKTAAGTPVIFWNCTGGGNQLWTKNSNGTITGNQSGLCLDVSGNSSANGAALDIYTCNGGNNQKWSTG